MKYFKMSISCKHSILSVLFLLSICANATTRKVLFIGNSYTYTNNMPLILQTIATAMGDTLIYDESDPGGYTLEQHSTNTITLAKIFSKQWDVVVLQEQSQLPAFPPAEVDTEVYPYAHILDSIIHVNDTCTQTMFLMTWAHSNGDPMNCPSYPVICTYDGMQQRLRQSYLQMMQDNKAILAPVGAAWKVAHDSFPALWLFQADSSHPLVTGSYLEASVLYASIFHKRTYGCSYLAGLSTPDAQTLQHVADKVTIDSLSTWQQYGHYPSAAFDYSGTSNTFTFTHVSPTGADYSWSFGDGLGDTASDPVHTYTANGSYTVSHTAFTDCFIEAIAHSIHIGAATATDLVKADSYPVNVMQDGNGNISFNFPGTNPYELLEVFDARGRCIKSYQVAGRLVADRFAPGFYVFRAFSRDRQISFCNKLVVY